MALNFYLRNFVNGVCNFHANSDLCVKSRLKGDISLILTKEVVSIVQFLDSFVQKSDFKWHQKVISRTNTGIL